MFNNLSYQPSILSFYDNYSVHSLVPKIPLHFTLISNSVDSIHNLFALSSETFCVVRITFYHKRLKVLLLLHFSNLVAVKDSQNRISLQFILAVSLIFIGSIFFTSSSISWMHLLHRIISYAISLFFLQLVLFLLIVSLALL
jgi:hypothetical protein